MQERSNNNTHYLNNETSDSHLLKIQMEKSYEALQKVLKEQELLKLKRHITTLQKS